LFDLLFFREKSCKRRAASLHEEIREPNAHPPSQPHRGVGRPGRPTPKLMGWSAHDRGNFPSKMSHPGRAGTISPMPARTVPGKYV